MKYLKYYEASNTITLYVNGDTKVFQSKSEAEHFLKPMHMHPMEFNYLKIKLEKLANTIGFSIKTREHYNIVEKEYTGAKLKQFWYEVEFNFQSKPRHKRYVRFFNRLFIRRNVK